MSRARLSLLILGLLLFLDQNSGRAVEVQPEIKKEQLTHQAVQGGELTDTYELTGENLVGLLTKMVDFSHPGSAIVFNRWTGQIFVKQTPAAHQEIEKILANVRRSSNRQVEIEARIMTVKGNDFSQKGLNFSGLDFLDSFKKRDLVGTDPNFPDASYDTNITFQNLTDASGTPTGGQLSLATLSKRFNVSTLIDFLQKEGEGNTLSAPKLTVFNNQRAHIKITRADYFVSELNVTGDAAATTVATKMKVDMAESGTVLDVTPTINKEGTITLELHPQFVTSDLTKTQTINVAGTGVLPTASQPFVRLPVFNNQSIDTTVTIEDGGVVVLGGMIDEREETSLQQIPGVSKAPIVGRLFKNNKVTTVKTHLLIFIRARALYPRAPAPG